LTFVFDELCEAQAGVVTTSQAEECGFSESAIRQHVRAGRWQRLHRTIYWTHSGPPPRSALLWAALLRAGRDAVLSHETAAELWGLVDAPSDPIQVSVPSDRRVRSVKGIRVHVRRAQPSTHPAREPRRTTVEQTVVDLTQQASDVDGAIAWIARACAKRLTRPERLAAAFAAQRRLRWREALVTAVAEVGSGCHSLLELRYLRDVERAHGLPAGSRQCRRHSERITTYSDVEYAEYGVNVELDGRVGHDGPAKLRDNRRDNRRVADGGRVLRYGWADVNVRACATARQVAGALSSGGWTGTPERCAARCAIGPIA
jgi:hypothetical protein